MKLKGIIGTLVLMLLVGNVLNAQEATKSEDCAKYRSLYFEYLKNGKYQDAAYFWGKAIEACGQEGLDAKFYVNGLVIYSKLMTDSQDSLRNKEFDDTLNMIYERRMLYENDPKWNADYASKLVSDGSQDFDKIDSLFTKSLAVLKSDAKAVHYKQYFKHLITNRFNNAGVDQKEEVRTFIIEEYIVLSDYIGGAIKTATEKNDENEVKRQEAAQAFLDKYFLLIAKDCEVLTPVLDKKLASLPQDPTMKLKKVKDYLTLMDLQKCQSTATYGKFVDTLISLDPTPEAYFFGAKYAEGVGNESKAINYLEKAVDLEGDGENKDEYLFRLANLQYKSGSYRAAYSTAQKVGNGEFKGEALYIQAICIAATANGCGESTFERKANYWLANDYVGRAIANGKTGVSSGKFLDSAPSSGDVFSEGLQMGASFRLSCWGESTTIR